MTTQDIQSLRAELHEVEGELHRLAAVTERIEQDRAAGSGDPAALESELGHAAADRRRYESRAGELRRQIGELERTLQGS